MVLQHNSRENQRWNNDIVYALTVHKTYLGIIGAWPLDVEFTSITRWCLAMLIHISSIGSLSVEVYWHCLGRDDAMDALLVNLSSSASLFKLFLGRLNFRHTLVLVNSIVEDWTVARNPEDRAIMTRYTDQGRLVSLTIIYLCYASGLFFVLRILPIDFLSTDKQTLSANDSDSTTISSYLLPTYCFFGAQPTFTRYCVIFVQALHLFVNTTSHCANDGFLFGLVMHLCGQFEILKSNFSRLRGQRWIVDQCEIHALIERHCHLIYLTTRLECAFNAMILVQLLMSALLLCVEGFQMLVALKANDTVAMTKHAVLIVTLLAQLFVYAYAGNALESKTEELSFAVYDSLWYDFDAKIMNDFTLVMLRGGIPCRITAGKFLSINLYSFKEILKASATYLSVLKALIDD